MSVTKSPFWRAMNATAPWMTLALLIALPLLLPNRVALSDDALDRQAEIAAALNAVPPFIGEWIGEDRVVAPEAQELLKPNAVLSRTYWRPNGQTVHLLVVHCSDARDMIGHYPPICYPSSGWVAGTSQVESEVVLDVDGRRLPMRIYMFRQIREHGAEEVIRIFSAFVLPGGAMTGEIGEINRQSERLAVSVQGVAQLQIITTASITTEEATEAAAELLSGVPVLLDALGIRRGTDHE